MFYQILLLIEKEIDSYLGKNNSMEFGTALLEAKHAIKRLRQFL